MFNDKFELHIRHCSWEISTLKNTHDDGGVGGAGLAGWTATTGSCTLLGRTFSILNIFKFIQLNSIYNNINQLLILMRSFIEYGPRNIGNYTTVGSETGQIVDLNVIETLVPVSTLAFSSQEREILV